MATESGRRGKEPQRAWNWGVPRRLPGGTGEDPGLGCVWWGLWAHWQRSRLPPKGPAPAPECAFCGCCTQTQVAKSWRPFVMILLLSCVSGSSRRPDLERGLSWALPAMAPGACVGASASFFFSGCLFQVHGLSGGLFQGAFWACSLQADGQRELTLNSLPQKHRLCRDLPHRLL